MADLSITYDGVMQAVTDLRNAGGDMWNQLQEFQGAVRKVGEELEGDWVIACQNFGNMLAGHSTQMSSDISDASTRLEAMAEALWYADRSAAHGLQM